MSHDRGGVYYVPPLSLSARSPVLSELLSQVVVCHPEDGFEVVDTLMNHGLEGSRRYIDDVLNRHVRHNNSDECRHDEDDRRWLARLPVASDLRDGDQNEGYCEDEPPEGWLIEDIEELEQTADTAEYEDKSQSLEDETVGPENSETNAYQSQADTEPQQWALIGTHSCRYKVHEFSLREEKLTCICNHEKDKLSNILFNRKFKIN